MKTLLMASLLSILCAMEQDCANPGGGSPSGGSPKDPTNAIAGISENRDLAGSTAQQVKDKFKPDASQYDKARQLYDLAKAKNNGWVTALTYAIKNGGRLDTQDFKDKAKAAATATKAFVDYANSVTGRTRVPIATVGVAVKTLLDLGGQIYDAYIKRAKQERNERADWVQKQLTWPTWADAK